MAKLLIVDDEVKIRELVCKYAQFEGHQVKEASDGQEAIEMALTQEFDLVIMDIMMPRVDGFMACKEIRKQKQTPILLLSALGEEYDRIHGFDLGIDDYVVKPFSGRELMLRVQAILKRTSAQYNGNNRVQIKDLIVDFSGRIVLLHNKKLYLSPKEYDLLFYMVENRGIALTRDKLLENVWGYDFEGDDRTLDTHIKLLRKSLEDYSDYIVTLRGVGYRFEKGQD